MISVAMTSHIGATQHDRLAKSNTISTGADLANVEKHNNHEYTEEDVARMQSNIDLSEKEQNQQYDRNLQKVERLDLVNSVQEIYHEEFDAAVAEYNQKQIEAGKPQRQITDYFESISENKKQEVAVEGLIQIGELENWKGMTMADKLRVVPVLESGLNVIATEIPGFKVAGASLHMNEGSPHIHYVGVCVDESEKQKGLNKRVGKSAVFTKEVLSEVLQNRLREVMEPQAKEIFGWDFKVKKTGRNQDLNKNEYVNQKLQEANKELLQQNERLMSQQTVLEAEIARLSSEKTQAEEQAQQAAVEAEKARTELSEATREADKAKDRYHSINMQMVDQKKRYDENNEIIDEQTRALEKIQDKIANLRKALPPPEELKQISAKSTFGGGVKLSQDEYDLLKGYADQSAAAMAYAKDQHDELAQLSRDYIELKTEYDRVEEQLKEFRSADHRIQQAEETKNRESEERLKQQLEELEQKLKQLSWMLRKAFGFLFGHGEDGLRELEEWKEYYEQQLGREFLTMGAFIKYWFEESDREIAEKQAREAHL